MTHKWKKTLALGITLYRGIGSQAREIVICRYFPPLQLGGYNILPKPNYGMVSLSSVESLDYFNSLGNNKSCHTNLLSEYEYTLAKEIPQGNKWGNNNDIRC